MKEWQIIPAPDITDLSDCSEFHPAVLRLLYNRGLKNPALVKEFFGPAVFYDPFLFKNMAGAVELIISHIKANNQIVVYGDYDADGVTASVVLLETLQILRAKAEVYLPDRVSEGYGLNKLALDSIAASGAKLVITVDNGIRNKDEVLYAQKLGLDVIITDHHVLPDNKKDLPDCLFIDPADASDPYPWRYLAGVGVAYKLVEALLAKSKLSDNQKRLISERCLDLVAVGTVSDMVSLLGENRWLVREGLRILNRNQRLGLVELIKVAKINNNRPLEAWNIGWQIGPRLNAASRLAHANTAFALLTTNNRSEAESLAVELNEQNIQRQAITAQMMLEVERQIDKDNLPLVIIGVAEPEQNWNEGIVGLVAGRIAEKYYRPTLIIARVSDESDGAPVMFKGSGRSIEGFNLIAAVEQSKDFLYKYGGHPMACGFSIRSQSDLVSFQEVIKKETAEKLDQADLVPKLKLDAELSFSDINLDLADQINNLAPFGQSNPQPRFASFGLQIDDIVTMGSDSQHIKFRLSSGGRSYWALSFNGAENCCSFKIGDLIDLAYYLEVNDFNGRREPQLKIVDIRLNN